MNIFIVLDRLFVNLHPIQLVPFDIRKEQVVCREGIGLFLLMHEKEQAGLTEGEIKVIGENIIRKTTDLYRPAVLVIDVFVDVLLADGEDPLSESITTPASSRLG